MRNGIILCGTGIAGLFLLNTTGATAQTAAAPASRRPSAWVKSLKITAVAVYSNPERRPDGSFILISGRKLVVLGASSGPPNVALTFRVEEESN